MIESMNSCCRGDYRIIRRNGAVIAFNPAKVARAVRNIYQAVSISPAINQVPCLSVSKDDASGSAGGASAPGTGEGAGGESDSDGGDGNGDGPRRRSTKKSTSRQVSPLPQTTSRPYARPRQSRHRNKSDHEAPHRWSRHNKLSDNDQSQRYAIYGLTKGYTSETVRDEIAADALVEAYYRAGLPDPDTSSQHEKPDISVLSPAEEFE